MKKLFYWSPCLDKVGTYKAVKNSALAINKYSKNKFKVFIINACGEWNNEKEFFDRNNINVINLNLNYFTFLPKTGFLGSRFSNIIIFIFSFFPLVKIIIKEKPDYLIGHLITSLPILIFNIFSLKSKFILRISGYPKLNNFRKFFWNFFQKKIYKVTCPSKNLKKQLLELGIFSSKKLFFLPDPVLNINKFTLNDKNKLLKNEFEKKNFFIAVGRLTKQKNFNYLISEFNKFSKLNTNYDLLIFGEGEERKKLQLKINNLSLEKKVFLMGYSDQVFYYMKKAQALILSSLWEDPGFVLMEAAFCNLFIISSNCKNGPTEFLKYGKGGLLFESNKENELQKMMQKFLVIDKKKIKSMKIIAKINCSNYTLFSHYKHFNDMICNYQYLNKN